MTVLLVYPPFVSTVNAPPVALTALSAYLKQYGIVTRCYDLNIEFLWYLIHRSDDLLNSVNDCLVQKLNKPGLASKSRNRIKWILTTTIPLVRRLIKDFNDEQEKILQESSSTGTLVSHLLVTVIWNLSNILFQDDFSTKTDPLTRSYHQICHDSQKNIKHQLLVDFLSKYNWNEADLVGFSILAETQFPYTVQFTKAIRAAFPTIKIAVGGPYITEVIGSISLIDGIFNDFDYFVCYEGESALLEILHETGSNNIQHPNVITKPAKPENRTFLVEDINALPPQDFSVVNLDYYKPWGLCLPIYSSKGCTWGKCLFCCTNFLKYREIDHQVFTDRLLSNVCETGITNIQIVDEDIRPKRLMKFSDSIICQNQSDISWSIQTRFYQDFDLNFLSRLKQAGLSAIEFGLESANVDTINRIRKGINLSTVRQIIRNCEAAEISIVLNFMIGFPGETESDAIESVRFVDNITEEFPNLKFMCNTQVVKIYNNSKFGSNPEQFNCIGPRYQLSPKSGWRGPSWLSNFLDQYKDHPLLSSRWSKANSVQRQRLGDDPHIALAKEWYAFYLSNDISVKNGEAYTLIKLGRDSFTTFSLNKVMADIIQVVEKEPRLSELKESFCNIHHFYDMGMVLHTLNQGLLRLNKIGALVYYDN